MPSQEVLVVYMYGHILQAMTKLGIGQKAALHPRLHPRLLYEIEPSRTFFIHLQGQALSVFRLHFY